MSSCYKTSNNKYSNLPPRMDDGRHFTDYRPNWIVNNQINNENNILNSHDYRKFLIENSKKIMEVNKKLSYMYNGSYNCNKDYAIGTMLPEKNKFKCNFQSCEVVHNYDNGIGTGRMHTEISNCLKNLNGNEFELEDNLCISGNSGNKLGTNVENNLGNYNIL
tara:strand:+ start:217 stop:705 length:489 start_codon:yes stop_codon:yes gene_type:complete